MWILHGKASVSNLLLDKQKRFAIHHALYDNILCGLYQRGVRRGTQGNEETGNVISSFSGLSALIVSKLTRGNLNV